MAAEQKNRAARVLACVLAAACGPSVSPPVDSIDPTSETTFPPDTCADSDCCADGCCDPDLCCDDGCPESTIDPDTESDSDSDTIDPTFPSGCDEVDCGPGVCVLDDRGAPTCECDPDTVAIGLACLPCGGVGDFSDIDVPAASLVVRVTVDGAAPPDSPLESASLSLFGPDGDTVELGTTDEGELVASVVPGRYRLVYAWLAGELLPRNQQAVVGWLDVVDGLEVDLALATIALSGNFTIDGETTPASQYEHAEIALVGALGDELVLGDTVDGEYQTLALAGGYELEYRLLAGGDVMPINAERRFGNVELGASGTPQTLDVDIPITQVAGAITIAGVQPPVSEQENGRITLLGAADEPKVVLGETRHGGYSANLIPGQYGLAYERLAGGAIVPVNAEARLADLDLSRDGVIDVDVPVVVVSGTYTLDGAPLPAELGGDAAMGLTNATGDLVELGHLTDGTFEQRVVPGEYEVLYAGSSDGTALPTNGGARLGEVLVDGTPFDIDVPSVALSGAFTIDGMAPPVMDDGGSLWLTTARGDSVLLGDTSAGTFSTRVVPGDYEVRYGVESAGMLAPVNPDVAIADVSITEALAIDIDVPVVELAGPITVAGAAPPADPIAALQLDDPHTGVRFGLGTTDVGAYAVRLVPTSYVVRYEGPVGDASPLPANRDAPLRCIVPGR